MTTYGQQAQLVSGSLVLSEAYVRALGDSSELMVIGSLAAAQVLPDDLLQAKISAIQVAGRVTVREENAGTIMSMLNKKHRPAKIAIIPAGFELVDMHLSLITICWTLCPAGSCIAPGWFVLTMLYNPRCWIMHWKSWSLLTC